MYWCFCFKSSEKLKSIRVVHLNGYVEDFDHSISVSEVIGKHQNHFMFTQSQLLSSCLKPLNLDYILQQGYIYFLLPHSTFQSSVSPIDFAQLVRNLSSIAKNPMAYKNKPKKKKSSNCTSPVCNSPASSPNRFSGRGIRTEPVNGVIDYGIRQRLEKSPTWKPFLATIQERSFNQRSESDLQYGVKYI